MGASKPVATASKKSKSPPKTEAKPLEKNLGGRPPIDYTDHIHGQVNSMLGYGLSMEQTAHVVGMSKSTLERKLKERSDQQGFDALEHARAKVIANLAQSAYTQATGYKRTELDARGKPVQVDVPPNGKMTQFLLNVLGGKSYVMKKHIDIGNATPDEPFELIVRDYRGKTK